AVVIAGLAVGVAALRVEAAAMGPGGVRPGQGGEQEDTSRSGMIHTVLTVVLWGGICRIHARSRGWLAWAVMVGPDETRCTSKACGWPNRRRVQMASYRFPRSPGSKRGRE